VRCACAPKLEAKRPGPPAGRPRSGRLGYCTTSVARAHCRYSGGRAVPKHDSNHIRRRCRVRRKRERLTSNGSIESDAAISATHPPEFLRRVTSDRVLAFTDRNPRLPWRGAVKAFAQQAHNGDLTRHHSHYPPRAGQSVACFSLAAAREVASWYFSLRVRQVRSGARWLSSPPSPSLASCQTSASRASPGTRPLSSR